MKPGRREFLHLSGAAITLSAVPCIAQAQRYPTHPIRWIVGFPPGGAADIVARLIGQWLSGQLGQPIIVENRTGAGSNIATEAVVKAPADGYTLLMLTVSNAINAALYDNLNFNLVRDIAPVASIYRGTFVMVINPSVPATTVPEFIAYAKSHPGKISMASGGNATMGHVAGVLFNMLTGVEMVHVPYRGDAPALTDVLGGQVQVTFALLPSSIGYIRAGTLRALAVTTAMRSQVLPDIPSVGEFVPGYEVSAWFGIGVPNNTPAEIVGKLNSEINAALADPKIKARLADEGGGQLALSPTDFGKLIAEETEKWAKVVKFSGAHVN